MVIDDFNVFGAICSRRPLEADSPLLIDPNAVLAPSVAGQRLKPVAGKAGQVPQTECRFQNSQSLFGLMAEALETGNPFALGKAPSRLIPVVPDHLSSMAKNTLYVKPIENQSPASVTRFLNSC